VSVWIQDKLLAHPVPTEWLWQCGRRCHWHPPAAVLFHFLPSPLLALPSSLGLQAAVEHSNVFRHIDVDSRSQFCNLLQAQHSSQTAAVGLDLVSAIHTNKHFECLYMHPVISWQKCGFNAFTMHNLLNVDVVTCHQKKPKPPQRSNSGVFRASPHPSCGSPTD